MTSNPISSPPYKKLTIAFDPELLLADLQKINSLDWVDHVNNRAYSGRWDVFPMRCSAQHVDAHPILQGFSLEMVQQWQNLPILLQCPAFHSILKALESYQCDIYSVRLMRLHAGAEIVEHRDHGVSYDSGEVRLHVPITSNPQVEFLVNRESVTMLPGELWYINADLPHAVVNRGDSDRIHLVIDCAVNKWLSEELCQRSCS